LSTRAIIVPRAVSVLNGTSPVTGFDEHECERVEVGLAGERFALRLFG
jgi:hypothetical protein